MGQYASEPVVQKDSNEYHDEKFVVGTSSMQGWRLSMEDSRTCLLSIPQDPKASFFAIFDGHGGSNIAEYASKNLCSKIVQRPEYGQNNVEEAIRRGYVDIDQDMSKDVSIKDEVAGSTAISVIIKDGKIYCGNVGDSRALVSVNGKSVDLSHDHKPSDKDEARRINCAGGWVSFDRVKGILAMSRALGDFPFKTNPDLPPEQQMLTAFPDVKVFTLTPDTEFVLLACDGIWDVLKNQEAVDFVISKVSEQRLRPHQICEELMTRCLASDSSTGNIGLDNMTVIIVALLQPDSRNSPISYAEWCTQVKSRRNARLQSLNLPPQSQAPSTNGTRVPQDGYGSDQNKNTSSTCSGEQDSSSSFSQQQQQQNQPCCSSHNITEAEKELSSTLFLPYTQTQSTSHSLQEQEQQSFTSLPSTSGTSTLRTTHSTKPLNSAQINKAAAPHASENGSNGARSNNSSL